MPNTNCLEGVKCPECGHEDGFYIQAKVLVFVTDEGTEAQNGEYEWDDSNYCQCASCKYENSLSAFTAPPPTIEDIRKSMAYITELHRVTRMHWQQRQEYCEGYASIYEAVEAKVKADL
jgi:hypothetical protein